MASKASQKATKDVNDLSESELDGLINGYRAAVHRSLVSQSAISLFGGGQENVGLSLNIVA